MTYQMIQVMYCRALAMRPNYGGKKDGTRKESWGWLIIRAHERVCQALQDPLNSPSSTRKGVKQC